MADSKLYTALQLKHLQTQCQSFGIYGKHDGNNYLSGRFEKPSFFSYIIQSAFDFGGT